jgi:DNA polymerase-3 subunit epsilon
VKTSWIDEGFMAFDIETTGLEIEEARIVTAAAVVFHDGEPGDIHTWLIKVDVPIPSAASDVHGITDEISQRDGQEQAQALAEMQDVLESSGLPVVSYNSAFDIPILNANLARQGRKPIGVAAVICPWIIDKQFNKYVRGKNQRRLKPTAERYGLELREEDWHGAQADALVAGRILIAQGAAYAAVRETPPGELSALIEGWRIEQEADFQAWLARQK